MFQYRSHSILTIWLDDFIMSFIDKNVNENEQENANILLQFL